MIETVVKIKVGNMKLDPFIVKSGLRQGDSISPIYFQPDFVKCYKRDEN
jgi:hypothetical protein